MTGLIDEEVELIADFFSTGAPTIEVRHQPGSHDQKAHGRPQGGQGFRKGQVRTAEFTSKPGALRGFSGDLAEAQPDQYDMANDWLLAHASTRHYLHGVDNDQRAAIIAYSGNDFGEMQHIARKVSSDKEAWEIVEELTAKEASGVRLNGLEDALLLRSENVINLDTAIQEHGIAAPTTLYRGMHGPIPYGLSPGVRFSDEGFSSWTPDPVTATAFATDTARPEYKTVFRIRDSQGQRSMPGNRAEFEYVMERDVEYVVHDIVDYSWPADEYGTQAGSYRLIDLVMHNPTPGIDPEDVMFDD